MTALVGADAGQLQLTAAELRAAAAELDAHTAALTAQLQSVAWIGGASSRFLGRWNAAHRPYLSSMATYLRDAAGGLDRNAVDQIAVSSVGNGASLAALLGGAPAASGDGVWDGIGDLIGEVVDFLTGDLANVWGGGDDGFPLGQLGAALLRVVRTGAFLTGGLADELFPVFNTGRLGVAVAGALEQIPGLAGVGRWLTTPGATTTFRVAGAIGGGVSTAVGLYDLYRQGNPVDAFRAEGAGYVADVAGTAFSASTTAFLVAPNPVTGALVIGTGLVWAGAEVVDHWDDISDFASGAWDAGTGFVGETWQTGTDALGDAWNAGTDFIGGIGSGAGDILGGLFG